MSWNPLLEPGRPDAVGMDSIETLIVPRTRDLGPFIRRALPAPQRQMVGPFIFFDQFGPAEFVVEAGFGVRPHPHIGLATVTYLYRGERHHPFRARADRARGTPRSRLWHSDLGRSAGARGGCRAELRASPERGFAG